MYPASYLTNYSENLEFHFKTLEIAVNNDPLLNNAQKSALHYVRRLSEAKEKEALSYLQTVCYDDIPALIQRTYVV